MPEHHRDLPRAHVPAYPSVTVPLPEVATVDAPHRHRRTRRRMACAGAAVAVAAGLSSCTAPVSVPAAPHAADPLCAEVVLALPRDLGDLPRLGTTSQATVAWGEPTSAIVLRCGVEPPGPTTDQCVDADDGTISVDWVAVPGQADGDGNAPWTFTTYGRSPAVEVRVPASVTSSRSTSFLLDLGPAISRVEQTASCL